MNFINSAIHFLIFNLKTDTHTHTHTQQNCSSQLIMISQYSSKCVAKESNGSHHFFLVNNDHGFEHEVKQRKFSFFKAKSTKIVDLMIAGPLACEWLLEIIFFWMESSLLLQI